MAAADRKNAGRRPPTFYQNYILREDQAPPSGLLGLQEPYGKGRQAHPDELLFIAIHQTFELWFKVVIDEILRRPGGIVARIGAGDFAGAARGARRLTKIAHVLRDQYGIVETISPTDFLVFRDVLKPSSGYDSCQFRALELASGLRRDGSFLRHLCGAKVAKAGDAAALSKAVTSVATAVEKKRPVKLREYSVVRKLSVTGDTHGLHLIARALAADSLRDAAYAAVESFAATGAVPRGRAREWGRAQKEAARAGRPFEAQMAPERAARIEASLAALYGAATDGKLRDAKGRALFDLVEALMEYDEAFRNFRTIHINMVLRVIGGRPGTGGSAGAQYLRTTLDYEFFPLFWSARNLMDGPRSD